MFDVSVCSLRARSFRNRTALAAGQYLFGIAVPWGQGTDAVKMARAGARCASPACVQKHLLSH